MIADEAPYLFVVISISTLLSVNDEQFWCLPPDALLPPQIKIWLSTIPPVAAHLSKDPFMSQMLVGVTMSITSVGLIPAPAAIRTLSRYSANIKYHLEN